MLNTPDHETILRQIVELLHIVETEPELKDGQLVSALEARGVPKYRAWRLVVFVPIAFGRPVPEKLHVRVSPTYVLQTTFQKNAKLLRDEAEYRAAADHLEAFAQHHGYKALALRSPEVNAVSNALDSGYNVDGGELQTIVVDLRAADFAHVTFNNAD